MRYTIGAIALTAALLPAQSGSAQEPMMRCFSPQVPVPSLGISGLECSNCSLYDGRDPRIARWEFQAEPVIRSVAADGPAANRLQPGDVIISIDGYLVTTREGGLRFTRPETGAATTLRIRRSGRELDVTINPTVECRRVPDAAPVAPAAPAARPVRPPAADSAGVAQRVLPPIAPQAVRISPALLPPGRLGLSFSCSQCSVEMVNDSVRVWNFAEPPTVTAVEPDGSAVRAGIRVGDRIVSVDSLAITSVQGGHRFGAIRSGEPVAFGILRGGAEHTTRLISREPGVPVAPLPAAAPRPAEPATVRYSGRLGDTMIHVTGEPVVVTETDTEIIIRSGGITVRLRRDSTGRGR